MYLRLQSHRVSSQCTASLSLAEVSPSDNSNRLVKILMACALFLACITDVQTSAAEPVLDPSSKLSYAFAADIMDGARIESGVAYKNDRAEALIASVDKLQLVGNGSMRWLLFNLYDAKFYSHSGKYQHASYPQALHLHYQKNIAAKHLLSATEKELKRIHGSKPEFAMWLASLEKFWPDIKKGDALTLYVNQAGHSSFIQNEKLIGHIQDSEFSQHFLSIWLSESTRDRKLRQRLIGLR